MSVELKRKGNTNVYSDESNRIVVQYHNTIIVKVSLDNKITLNSNGWHTATTKQRMNQASTENRLGFYVFQKNFDWFVETADGVKDFYDGITFDRGE